MSTAAHSAKWLQQKPSNANLDALPVNESYYLSQFKKGTHAIDANGSPRHVVTLPSSDPFNFREAESVLNHQVEVNTNAQNSGLGAPSPLSKITRQRKVRFLLT